MKKLFLTFWFSLAFVSIFGQNIEPLDLAKLIFAKNPSENILKNYIADECVKENGCPCGKNLSKGILTKFLLIEQTNKTAVVDIILSDSISKTAADVYVYFKKIRTVDNSVWKMTATRSLAMSGLISMVLEEYEKKTPQQIDSAIVACAGKNGDIFSSKETYDYELGTMRLTIASDEKIIQHFLDNEADFDKLKNLALKKIAEKGNFNSEIAEDLVENFKADYPNLFINSIDTGGYQLGSCNRCVNFLIGGVIDNTVGYLYVADKNDVPKIHPDRIIMLREIGKGWYLYKTT